MQGFFVGAFLYNPNDHTVLLQKRDLDAQVNPGLWGFFGGSSEEGETPEQAITRELKEELGIEINPSELVSLRTYFNEKQQRQSYIFVIESDLKKSDMTLTEGEDFDWIPVDKVFDYKLTENTVISLKVLQERLRAK